MPKKEGINWEGSSVIWAIMIWSFGCANFVLEVRWVDKNSYLPDLLYMIWTGLPKISSRAEINILADPGFSHFRETLDSEFCGRKDYWETTVPRFYLIHLYTLLVCALQFVVESIVRYDTHNPSQLHLVDSYSDECLVFTEQVSKTIQGSFRTGRKPPKKSFIKKYTESRPVPDRWLVRLYKLYNSKCQCNRPDDAFHRTPEMMCGMNVHL